MLACKLLQFITVWVFLVNIQFGHGFIFDQPMDCVLSPWTDWAFVNGEDIFTRNRAILQHSLNGGRLCIGDVHDTKTRGIPTLIQTADSIIDNFIRPHGHMAKKRAQLQGQTVGEWRDLLILIDASGSIGRPYFDRAKNSLALLLGAMCPDPDPFKKGTNQAAMIEFASRVNVVFDFDDNQSLKEIQAAILRTPYTSGITCTATAFHKTLDVFTSQHGARDRADVVKEILILTDGQSNCGGNAYNASLNAQSKATVYGLVTGSPTSASRAELESYITGPLDKHMFAVTSYQDLEKLLQLVKSQMVSRNMSCIPFKIQG